MGARDAVRETAVVGWRSPSSCRWSPARSSPGRTCRSTSAACTGLATGEARKAWDVVLLGYCLVAGVLPVWLLLQPRGQLGGYFLYAALGAGAVGLAFGGATAEYPAFRGWDVTDGQRRHGHALSDPVHHHRLRRLLGIPLAHRQRHDLEAAPPRDRRQARRLRRHAAGGDGRRRVALLRDDVRRGVAAARRQKPNEIYAHGIGKFLEVIHLPPQIGITFALMAFTTFVYDTLDVCTRLGRFILQELTGWRGRGGRWFGTALTAGVPLFFLLRHPSDSRPTPVWRIFWNLFGASNQLLAALTLLGVTVWLWRTRRARWVWFVTGLPTVFMYVMSTWALASMTVPKFRAADGAWTAPHDPVPWIGLVLLGLAALMLIEAVRVLAVARQAAAIGRPAGARAGCVNAPRAATADGAFHAPLRNCLPARCRPSGPRPQLPGAVRSDASLTPAGNRSRADARNSDCPRRRRRDALGVQLLDVHALRGQHAADLAHDPRPILSHELQLHQRPIDSAPPPTRSGCTIDSSPAARQRLQRRGQRVGAIGIDLDAQDAGKVPGQMRHPALDPIAAMLGHDAGQRLDQPRPIGAQAR